MDSVPPSPAPKKGLPGIAIAALGCLGVIILVVVVGGGLAYFGFRKATKDLDFKNNPEKSAALLALKFNPDLEVQNTNDATHEITVKNKKTGEIVTLSFDDIKNGKFSMKDSKGQEVSFDGSQGANSKVVVKSADGETVIGGTSAATKPPGWVPAYPAVKTEVGGMRSDKKDGVSGTYTFETGDAAEQVKGFFEGKLKDAGFEVETNAGSSADGEFHVVKGTKDATHQTVNVMITGEKGKTGVVLTYEGAK